MYTPKNRIVTNLYTSGQELVYESTKENYIGFYYKLFNGTYNTGKSPNDPPNEKLIKLEDRNSVDEESLPQNSIAYGDNPPIPFTPSTSDINPKGYNESVVIEYAQTQQINLDQLEKKFLPSQYYPKPNVEDYKLGSFTRYFCVKVNQNIYLELSKKEWTSLTDRDPNYLWEPYIPFQLQWTLIGDQIEVFNTNRKLVILTQQKGKIKGLGRFLKENYLKFYK